MGVSMGSSGGSVNGVANTLAAWATVTSGAANTVLATIVAPTPGLYDVTVTVILSGTAEVTPINMRLRENTNEVTQLPTITGVVTQFRLPRVNVSGGNLDMQIKGTTPTVGSIYTAILHATRIG